MSSWAFASISDEASRAASTSLPRVSESAPCDSSSASNASRNSGSFCCTSPGSLIATWVSSRPLAM